MSLIPYRTISKKNKLRSHFHSGQSQAMRSTARFIAMMAGTQGGKACFEPDWLLGEMEHKGDGDYLVGTATFPLLELKLLPEFLSECRLLC